ncbi:T9SS type A sorting domain-containing protein [Flavobacterium sp.]|uniref:T9SS type A sorting domain-containing protein n=1 Tax=Flavobacterium sp. TaxID=239 RepID=UPI004048BF9A
MKKNLLSLFSLLFASLTVTAQCDSPTFPGVNSITQNAATVFWQDLPTNSWNLDVSVDGVSYTNISVNANPYVITGLPCGSNITVIITSICGPNILSNPVTITFLTDSCNQEQPGQPESYTACMSDSNPVCFNLTDNDINLIGTLNPTDHVISYHATNDDANNNTNPLSSPYCVGLGINQQVFARVANINDGTTYISVFFLHVTEYNFVPQSLISMEQCDSDNNGTIIFDLTTVEAQLNTTNTLTYYASQSDAENNSNPISNPSTYIIPVQPSAITLFIRESIPNGCDNIYNFNLRTFANCNLASVCSLANSLCGSLGIPFHNTVNFPSGGSMGCLGSTPNPTWFYLPISNSGTINLMIQQNIDVNFSGANIDVDYIVYGPFTDPTTPCNGQLTNNNVVSCSYSAAALEYPIIPNAIAGQYYLIMVTNFSNIPGYVRINDLGNSQGTIDCTGIRLNAFLDQNTNGIQDNGEINFPLGQFQYEINNNGTTHNITSPTGMYTIYENNASNLYNINYTIDPAYAAMYAITTSNYNNVSASSGSGITTYNFPVTIVQSYNDLAVTLIPMNSPRPGFTYANKIFYGNIGNQAIASGTLTFTKDNAITITSISESGTTTTPTGFSYDFTNLLPFEYREITVTFQVPTIPTVTAGEYLTNSVSILPLTDDIVPENNTSTLSQMIINAYDPNDKMESRGEEILFSSFTSDDYLYYTVRFENTGNANAINVRINDVLDARLDENSIKMIDASHSYVLDRINNNLTWKFDNIMLPVSVANTDIGKGYVIFKVKPKPGYSVGDVISNTASIYFDFNPAIITNTFTSTFVATLNSASFTGNSFLIYPNPTSDYCTITSGDAQLIKTVNIYDVLGKRIFSKDGNNELVQVINTSEFNSGIYLIEIIDNNNQHTTKKLVIQ